MKYPDTLPDYLRPIWDELDEQMRDSIGAVGLEALCVQVYRMRDAQARVTADGMVVVDAKGNPVPHPALDIEKRAQAEVRTWLDKYGR